MNRRDLQERSRELLASIKQGWSDIPAVMRWGTATLIIAALLLASAASLLAYRVDINFDLDVIIQVEKETDPMTEQFEKGRAGLRRIGEGIGDPPDILGE